MSRMCWIDWIDASDLLHGRRRIFGPSKFEPALLGLGTGDEPVDLNVGPDTTAVVRLADGRTLTVAPNEIAAFPARNVESVVLRAA